MPPSDPAAQPYRRPIFFRLLLVLIPLGLIVGILVVLIKYAAEADEPAPFAGRGQPLSTERLTDIEAKLGTIAAQGGSTRAQALESFLSGTLGSDANAGLESHRLQLSSTALPGTWLSFVHHGEGRRAGLTLLVELPADGIAGPLLPPLVNAVEDLVNAGQPRRDLVLLFHPPGDPRALDEDELARIQRQLELTRGGELVRLQAAQETTQLGTEDELLKLVEGDLLLRVDRDDGNGQATATQLEAARALRQWLDAQVL